MLIALAGLPGVGKTTIAIALARELGAVHLRIDSIEQAIRRSATHSAVPIDDAGYLAGYAIAEDNLRLGRTVIADCVNPWPQTRDAWLAAAHRAGAPAVEIEVVCSDTQDHRQRVESRTPDLPGFEVPTWQDVLDRDYRSWDRERVVVDTARSSIADIVEAIRNAVAGAVAEARGESRKA